MQQHEALHKYNQHIILEGERNLPAARLRLDCLPPLLPNNPFRSTAVAAPYSTCPPRPRREREAERASHKQRGSSKGKWSNQRGRLGGGSTQQVSFEALPGQ